MWIDDQILARYREAMAIEVFVPESTMVVLGSSNQASLEVDLEACARDEIPVTRRYGGGGTVVLYPGCVVITIGTWVKDHYRNDFYFKGLNQAVIHSLAQQWPYLRDLTQSGISDIVWKDQKIGGTSLFRSRHYLLYQASLLVNVDKALISRCLKHPTREPEYRKGRSHERFLVGLADLVQGSPQEVVDVLRSHLAANLKVGFKEDLVDPVASDMKSLDERLARAETLSSI